MYTPFKYRLELNLGEAPEIEKNRFVGREAEIDAMKTHLSFYDESSQRKVLVISGPGGIGKTQLAIKFAKECENEFSSIFWLSATDRVALRRSLSLMASRIFKTRRRNAHEMNGPEEEGREVEQVLKWLSNAGNNRWLLIFDGYDSPEVPYENNISSFDLRQYFPYVSHGRIIITTRSGRLSFGIPLLLKKLDDVQESLEILVDRSERPNLKHGTTSINHLV